MGPPNVLGLSGRATRTTTRTQRGMDCTLSLSLSLSVEIKSTEYSTGVEHLCVDSSRVANASKISRAAPGHQNM